MSNLIQHSVHLTENNLKKIANAIENTLPVTLSFLNKHLTGNHPMMMLKTQIGGFIQALIPFLTGTVLPALTGTVLPALASGALGSLASFPFNKAIKAAEGNGLSNFGEVSSGGCVKPKLIGGSLRSSKSKSKGSGLYSFGSVPPRR